MKYEVQQAIVADFNETTSVLFSTDISSRGLDIENVDWVVQVRHYVNHYHFSCIYLFSCCNLFIFLVFFYSLVVTYLSHLQVDCPENIDNYIHRVGRTARYNKKGKSLVFLCPEEEAMLEKLKATESKIPIHIRKVSSSIFCF